MEQSWPGEIDRAVEGHFEQLVRVRRHLHAHPEPSNEEYETTRFLARLLEDEGFVARVGPAGRGVIAELPGEDAGPKIALRGDIDALRIHDTKQVAYRSQNKGIMHACGHDAHTSTVFGAMLGLRDLRAGGALPWPVRVRAIFQPAEETGNGALEMVEAGALEGVEAILATHVDPSRQVGRLGLRSGVLTANCDAMTISITGRGGHAARPHETIDPIAAAAQLISSIYLFVPRATDSHDTAVISIGHIQGGYSHNVIPEEVELSGTLRTLDAGVRERTMHHIRQLVRGIAETSGTKIEVSFHDSGPSVYNDPGLMRLIRSAGEEVVGADHLDTIKRPSMGSEDFAFYLDHVVGALFRVGCASSEVGSSPLHTPTFDIDEAAISIAAKILARCAVRWFDPNRAKGR